MVGRRSCLDALMIDWALAKEAQVSGKNLSVSWVDFQKAFDRVPHFWIARCLETVQAPRVVVRCREGHVQVDHKLGGQRWRGRRGVEALKV